MKARSPFFRACVVALVCVNGVFAYLIWSFLDERAARQTAFAPLSPAAQGASEGSSAASTASSPIAEVEDIAARPLFSRERIAWAPPAHPLAQTPSALTTTLAATIIGIVATSQLQTVFILTPSAPQGAWVESGAMIDGWKVVRVTPKSATLAKEGALQTLHLFSDER